MLVSAHFLFQYHHQEFYLLLHAVGLSSANPSKCLSVWFGTNANDLSVSLNGTVIDIANTMQLLGVSVDRDLKFQCSY